MKLTKLALAAVIAATGGIALTASPAVAAPQTETAASCNGDSYVNRTLAAGSGWELCWRVDDYRGLVLDKVAFAPRDEGRSIMILDSIALSQLNVPYDTGLTEFNDVTTYQVGGRRLQALTDVDCPTGEILNAYTREDRPDWPTLCVTEEDSGLAYRSNVGGTEGLYVAQGTDLVLHTMSRIGWYEYQTEYRFHDDGEVTVHLGATGDLSPNDYSDAVNWGWPVGEGDSGFAVNHYHSAFWKVDFAIDNGKNQKVEKIITEPNGLYGTTGDTGKTPQLETRIEQVPTEQKMFTKNREQYRVVNPDSLNADGHARSYEVIMNSDRAYNLNPETDYDIAWAQAEPDEIHASYNLIPSKANQSVTDYVAAGEVMKDPVAFVNVGFHHVNRDEDQSPMPIHWQGFTLYPRDLTAQAPNIPEGRKYVNGDVRTQPSPQPTAPAESDAASDGGSGAGAEGGATAGSGSDGSGTDGAGTDGTGTTGADGTSGSGSDGSATDGSGTEATASSDDETEEPADGPAAEITTNPIAAGATQGLRASGFTPGETVRVSLDPGTGTLASIPANGEGIVEGTFVIPADTRPGSYNAVVAGQSSGASATAGFDVVAASPAFAALGSTGASPGAFVAFGAALLVGGLGLAVLAATRRPGRRAVTA